MLATYLPRLVFGASTFATVLNLLDASLWRKSFASLAAPYTTGVALLLTVVLCLVCFRHGRLLLPNVTLGKFLRAFAKALIITYFSLALLVGVSFLAVFGAVGMSPKEAGILSLFVALLFPLWLSPAAAAVSSWRALSAAGTGTANPSVKGTSCGKPQAAPYLER